MALFLQSDPMAVVYTKGRDGALQELGRTEVVLNSLDPKWITKLMVTYHFEVVQTLVYVSMLPSLLFIKQIQSPSFMLLDKFPSIAGSACMM